MQNAAEAPDLNADERRCLSALADVIIPPSAAYGVPGAGDADIVQTIVGDARRRGLSRLRSALAALDALAMEATGTTFADAADRPAIGETFRRHHRADAEMIANLTAQCYYRDLRVMRSLGMEARPPHPKGYEIPEGDWSLLDPVRRKDALYRKAD
jgi:hypothetical protein